MIYVPMMSTSAGRTLTAQQWARAGVDLVSYRLTDLLHKPGVEYLKTCKDFARYLGWTQPWILNASMSNALHHGHYTLQSPYDGSYHRYTVHDVLSIIQHMKPAFVILPEGFEREEPGLWRSLPTQTMPFFASIDAPAHESERGFGLWVNDASDPHLVPQTQPLYMIHEGASLLRWRDHNIEYLETNQAADDACAGLMYMSQGLCDLKDPGYAEDFRVLDETCACDTCSTFLTRAYLAHLFLHTPLLCQRLLVQHNAHFARNNMNILQSMPFTTP